jgi:hypothetical protein
MNPVLAILLLIVLIVIVLFIVYYSNEHIHELKIVSENKHLYVGDYFYKIYPLCCDECKKHAEEIFHRYAEASGQDLPVVKIISHYITTNKLEHTMKDSPHGYLVLKLEKFVPVRATEDNVKKISDVIKYFEAKNVYLGQLTNEDLAIKDGKVILINLDSQNK